MEYLICKLKELPSGKLVPATPVSTRVDLSQADINALIDDGWEVTKHDTKELVKRS